MAPRSCRQLDSRGAFRDVSIVALVILQRFFDRESWLTFTFEIVGRVLLYWN